MVVRTFRGLLMFSAKSFLEHLERLSELQKFSDMERFQFPVFASIMTSLFLIWEQSYVSDTYVRSVQLTLFAMFKFSCLYNLIDPTGSLHLRPLC